MREFIDSLDLHTLGFNIEEFVNNDHQYIVNLNSSNDFSKVFSLISTNNKLNLEDNSKATVDESEFKFTDGYYEITLSADFNKDFYQMSIEEK